MQQRRRNRADAEWVLRKLREIASRMQKPDPAPPPTAISRRRREAAVSVDLPAYPQVPAPADASRLQREALNWSPPCTLSAEELANMDAWARSDRSS